MLTPSQLDLIATTYRSLAADPGFRARPTQKRMIRDVAAVLAQPPRDEDAADDAPGPLPLLVEAPTGTGKSLAYLTAAVPLALELGGHVVISTGTVALQEQLVHRDIPRFLAKTGLKATVALAKGRSRFLCPRSLESALSSATQEDLFGGESVAVETGHEVAWMGREPTPEDRERLVKMVQDFARGNWSGDLDVLEPPLPEHLRTHVTTTAAGCVGKVCPYATHCPLLIARQEARSATIVVSNHDLLLADLLAGEGGGSFLPDPDETLYVLDEGHHLELKARSRESVDMGLDALGKLLEWADRFGHRIATLPLPALVDRGAWASGWAKALGIARIGIDMFCREVSAYAAKQPRSGPLRTGATVEVVARFPFGAVDEELRVVAGHLSEAMQPLAEMAEVLVSKMRTKDAEVEHKTVQLAGRIAEVSRQVVVLAGSWANAPAAGHVVHPNEAVARWISRSQDGTIKVHSCLASGARLLERLLWSKGRRVVVTSATLSEAGDFRRTASELGLYFRPHKTCVLPSPFALAEQAELIIPALRNQPANVAGHTQEVTDWLASNLDTSTLATLVLFTSRSQMKAVHDGLPAELRKDVQCQGDRSKDALISRHEKRVAGGKRSILFGLASFAEGIDLPGDLCRQVVIVKLPFAVPDDPIEVTLAEAIEANGGNAFIERVVPEAIRKLVQACGRLIRTETDSGRIVILDRRLLDKAYGRRMLEALPPFRRVIGQPVKEH